jgi:Protein kinase domain
MARPATDRILVNRYALKTPLGRGGMGVVWRAHDVVLGREVAVKEVAFPPGMPDAERHSAQARVTREARAAARLNHQGVVTLYDVVTHHGGVFIVMELVEARTLAELIQVEGPLAPERVAEIGAQLASALEAAHQAGIVHRDVKPANVLVTQAGAAKLTDFGVASLSGDPRLTTTGMVIGSPAYMAPEQAQGEPTGPPADFWALGATLYFAVEGQPPFDKGASMATLAAVVNEAPQPMRRAGSLAPLITALLAKDPEARPSGPKVRAWLGWLLVVALPAPPTGVHPVTGKGHAGPPAPAWKPMGQPGPDSRPSRPVLPPAPTMPRRRGGRLLGVVVALLLAGGLLAAWLTNSIGTDPGMERAAPVTTTSDAGADPEENQAARATTGSGHGATATTRRTSATTKQPVTTQVPTTPTTAAQRGLPASWRPFTNRAGSNRVGVPPGFRARTRQSYNATVVEEKGGARRVFTVRSQNPSAPLPQASRDYRAWARRNFAGFREVRYAENQTYAGRTGAVVFEYRAVRDGRQVHVRHVNVKGRTWGYNVELIVPAGQWDDSQGLARQFEQAFRPLG